MPETLEQYRAQFVESKKAAGIEYKWQTQLLKKFLTVAAPYLTEDCALPKAAVLAWNSRRGNECPKTRQQRVNTVRAFAEYLAARGIPAYVSPIVHEGGSNYVPHIFSNNELARLFHAIDNRPNVTRMGNWYIMPIIFRTLYACGLRRSEAVNLRVRDVDLDTGVLTILETKFHKDRLVPVHEKLLVQLRDYAEKMLISRNPDAPFFPKSTGEFYESSALYTVFRKCLWDAGISHGGKSEGPRVHDLRHTFAVHCLRKWMLAGDDISHLQLYRR